MNLLECYIQFVACPNENKFSEQIIWVFLWENSLLLWTVGLCRVVLRVIGTITIQQYINTWKLRSKKEYTSFPLTLPSVLGCLPFCVLNDKKTQEI